MRVAAVTGASGYIGRHLVTELLAHDWVVRGLSRNGRSDGTDHQFYCAVEVDVLREKVELFEACAGVDVVFHCAGEIGDERRMYDLNVLATDAVCEAALQAGARLVHLSSAGVYASRRSGTVDENSEKRPRNVYEETKQAAEETVCGWRMRGLAAVVAQPTTVVSIDMPNDSLRRLASAVERGRYVHFANVDAMCNYLSAADLTTRLRVLGELEVTGPFILNNPIAAQDLLRSISIGVGREDQAFRRLPLSVGLAAGWIGDRSSRLPFSTQAFWALGASVVYSDAKWTRATGLKPSNDLLDELTRIAARSVPS